MLRMAQKTKPRAGLKIKMQIKLTIPRQRDRITLTSVRVEFEPDISVECPHAPSPSAIEKQQSSTSMKTPRNHPRLAWTSIRAGALAGAIVVLLCRSALGQTIPNPSFEADTVTTSPGYIS